MGFMVYGLGFKFFGVRFMVYWFMILKFGVWGLGFRD